MVLFIVPILLATVFVLANAGGEVPDSMMPAIEACAKEYDISLDYLITHEAPPPGKECFHKCVAVKMGVMTEDGKGDFEAFKAKLEEHHATAALIQHLDKCSKDLPTDPCVMADKVWTCLKEG